MNMLLKVQCLSQEFLVEGTRIGAYAWVSLVVVVLE